MVKHPGVPGLAGLGGQLFKDISGFETHSAMPSVTHQNPIRSAWQFGAFIHNPDVFHIGIEAVSLLAGHFFNRAKLLQFT